MDSKSMTALFNQLLKDVIVKYREIYYYYHCYSFISRGLRQKRNNTIYPTIVQVQTLNRCNGRCVMCPYSYTVAQREHCAMSEERYRKIVKEIASWPVHGLLVLNFQNEPFFDERIEQFISIAREQLGRTWLIEITTNGILLTPSRIDSLLKQPPDVLNVSLNAYSKQAYERIMPAFSWKVIQSNLTYLVNKKSANMKLYLRYVRQADNIYEYKEFKKHWNHRGVPIFAYEFNDRAGTVRFYERLSSGVVSSVRRILRKRVARIFFKTCPLVYCQANITAEGKYILCCNDYQNISCMGDVNTRDISSIFNREKYQQIRQALSKGRHTMTVCDHCKFHHDGIWLQ